MKVSAAHLLERFAKRDRRALAALLTLVEAGQAPASPVAQDDPAKRTLVVGIAGSGGAGKSTLVGKLLTHVRSLGQTVAVLACDPQSPLTGGALLGDRIRVQF